MANVLGTITPTAVVQRALRLMFAERPILNEITVDVKDLGGNNNALFNQTVNTRILNIPTVNAFGTGAADTAYTNIPVVLDQFKEVHLAFTAAEYNSTSIDLLDQAALPCATAIANHLVDAVAAKWVIGTFTNSTTVASGWTYTNTFLPIRTALVGRGVRDDGFLIVNSTVWAAFLGDTTLVAALNNPANAAAISTGKLARAAGIAPMEYYNLPTTGNMVGFAGTKRPVAVANRVTTDPRRPAPGLSYDGTFDAITDPTTGFSVVLNTYISQATLAVNYRVLVMYGIGNGNPACGQILKTA